MNIDVNYDQTENKIRVKLEGDLDLNTVSAFKRCMDEKIDETPANVEIDCCDLRYIDSTGIGVLVSVLKKVREYDGNIKLKELKPYLFKIFDVTGLTNIFEIEVA
ncbi:MAG: STAS domain-containing protein [Christensenellaceae bacterium]